MGRIQFNTDTGETGEVLHRFDDHRAQVAGVGFSPDGKYLSSCGSDNRVLTYNLSDLKKPPIDLKRVSAANEMRYLDSGLCAVSTYGGGLELCQPARARSRMRFSGHQLLPPVDGQPARKPMIRALSASPDGKHLVSTDNNGWVYVWPLDQ